MLDWNRLHTMIDHGQHDRAVVGRRIVYQYAKPIFDILDLTRTPPFSSRCLEPRHCHQTPQKRFLNSSSAMSMGSTLRLTPIYIFNSSPARTPTASPYCRDSGM